MLYERRKYCDAKYESKICIKKQFLLRNVIIVTAATERGNVVLEFLVQEAVTSYRRYDSFLSKSWLHVATTGGAYEIRVERADNGLMDLKRGIERTPRNS